MRDIFLGAERAFFTGKGERGKLGEGGGESFPGKKEHCGEQRAFGEENRE